MMTGNKVVCLIGDPGEGKIVSKALMDHLAKGLGTKGAEVSVRDLPDGMRDDPDGLIAECLSADVVVITFPIILDSLPSGIVSWMERMAPSREGERPIRLLGIVHGDHPDPEGLELPISILKNFCDGMRFNWIGGLGMPMMPMVMEGGFDLEGRKREHLRKALDLSIGSIMEGSELPETAFEEMSIRSMPEFLYLMRANKAWKEKAKEHGARYMLMDSPFMAGEK